MMEAVRTSETSVHFNVTTRCYIPEYSKHHTRRCENLKCHKLLENPSSVFSKVFKVGQTWVCHCQPVIIIYTRIKANVCMCVCVCVCLSVCLYVCSRLTLQPLNRFQPNFV
jgi:hypothetical protein